MQVNSLDDFLSLLDGVKNLQGNEYIALCPSHDDHNPSLSVTEKNEKILFNCFAGCSTWEILDALNLQDKDLFLDSEKSPTRSDIVETYDYTDEGGNLLFQVCRTEDKSFPQRRPSAEGWTWGLGDTERVLYNLPEVKEKVQEGGWIFLTEGEKDAGNLNKLDLVATCNPMGAGNWKKGYTETLEGANVVILPDNDDEGRKHAFHVAKALGGKAESVKILEIPDLPHKGDVSDWLKTASLPEKQLKKMVKEKAIKADNFQLQLDLNKDEKDQKKKRKPGPKATYYKLIHDIEPDDLSGPPAFPVEAVRQGVFEIYLDWIEDNTEESISFAFASLRNLIGLAIGRDYKVWYSGSLHSPVFFDVLIGRTSRTRKTSSIKTAYDLIRDAYDGKIREFDTIWGIGSAEGLLAKLQSIAEKREDPPKVVIREGEFEKLMHKITQSTTSNLKPQLIKAWDLQQKLENRTKNNPLEVKHPSVSIIASTVVENVKGYMTEDVKRGGFFNRFCWWVSTPQEPIPFRENKRPNMLQNNLEDGVKTLIERGKRRESIDWNEDLTEDARDFWTKFYRKWFENDGEDSFVTERTPALTVRHAAFFALQHESKKITKEDLLRAKGITDYLKNTAHYALGQFERGETSPGIRRVIKALKENGQMKASDLSQKTRSYFKGPDKGEALYRALDNLEKLGHIKKFKG